MGMLEGCLLLLVFPFAKIGLWDYASFTEIVLNVDKLLQCCISALFYCKCTLGGSILFKKLVYSVARNDYFCDSAVNNL
jgi:hypothetical protein